MLGRGHSLTCMAYSYGLKGSASFLDRAEYLPPMASFISSSTNLHATEPATHCRTPSAGRRWKTDVGNMCEHTVHRTGSKGRYAACSETHDNLQSTPYATTVLNTTTVIHLTQPPTHTPTPPSSSPPTPTPPAHLALAASVGWASKAARLMGTALKPRASSSRRITSTSPAAAPCMDA